MGQGLAMQSDSQLEPCSKAMEALSHSAAGPEGSLANPREGSLPSLGQRDPGCRSEALAGLKAMAVSLQPLYHSLGSFSINVSFPGPTDSMSTLKTTKQRSTRTQSSDTRCRVWRAAGFSMSMTAVGRHARLTHMEKEEKNM